MSVCVCVFFSGLLLRIVLQITPLDSLPLSAALKNTRAAGGKNMVAMSRLIPEMIHSCLSLFWLNKLFVRCITAYFLSQVITCKSVFTFKA